MMPRIAPFLTLWASLLCPFLCLVLLALPAQAQSSASPYVVPNVTVDIFADSAVKARNQAFLEAQGKAFKMLAERFLSADELAAFKSPDLTVISGMVADFEINNEQLSKRRYIGNYTFRFKEAAVQRYFGHGPMGYVSGPAGASLIVLPVFMQNGKTILWDGSKNPWLKLWQEKNAASVNFIVPLGDVSDVMDAREADMPNISAVGLKRIKARYNASDVAIAMAVFDGAISPPLKVDLYRTDRGKAELAQSIPVPVKGEKKLGELMRKALGLTQSQLADNWKLDLTAANDNMAAASGETSTAVTETPARPATPYTPSGGTARASVRFNTMGEWLTVRRALNGIPSLRAVRIASLTTNQADLELSYNDWSSMNAALAARGLTLTPMGPSSYALTRTRSGYGR